ncbi:hypothetical protein GYA93_02670 [Gordonia desulfuricans]|uniref:Uncharacterized protein n=1 Tax=Gordonia desulfuricans TaxID=89051 RepID=A0A7K3LJP5_9ACTN|nr:hypothetical protein [Gordonia desulfuricans]NDK88489.1 hypothetical protein [Gordonia desulfuricans]
MSEDTDIDTWIGEHDPVTGLDVPADTWDTALSAAFDPDREADDSLTEPAGEQASDDSEVSVAETVSVDDDDDDTSSDLGWPADADTLWDEAADDPTGAADDPDTGDDLDF